MLIVLTNLNPVNSMKLYNFLSIAWSKVKLALLQRARNVQTNIETLVYTRAKSGKIIPQLWCSGTTIPEPCGPTLVHTILHAQLNHPPNALPTDCRTLNNIPTPTLYEHDRCNLYVSVHVRRFTIIGRALFCLIYKIFNYQDPT